ncbi:MAG: nuclear transport factor 2 family protein [Acidobacteriota bacterium]
MSDLHNLENELNQLINAGSILEAFDRFYADDVVMFELDGNHYDGKVTNRAREEAFIASVETWHGVTLHGVGVGDDVTYSEWTFDFDKKGEGRQTFRQVAARRWRDGQIVEERFFAMAG